MYLKNLKIDLKMYINELNIYGVCLLFCISMLFKPKNKLLNYLTLTFHRYFHFFFLPDIVSLAVKFALPQKAGVPERVPARGAPHTALVPESVRHPEQEPVPDPALAPDAQHPVMRICGQEKLLHQTAEPLRHFQTSKMFFTHLQMPDSPCHLSAGQSTSI